MSTPNNNEAYITLATNDTYAIGALVLASSLREVKTSKKLAILITPDVSDSMIVVLRAAFDDVVPVDVLDSEDAAHLALMSRPELGITLTKIHCWSQTQYSKAVFLDADTLVIKNCDELFDNDEIAAVTDVGWPDIFNSGVFVFKPSDETFRALLCMAVERGSFDGGDQGLLNQFFTKWTRLSFIYNMVAAVAYTYLPAYKQFGGDTKIVHFLGGGSKPWNAKIDEDSGLPTNLGAYDAGAEHLLHWWTLFVAKVKPALQGDLRGLAGRFATLSLADTAKMQRWEEGEPEYMGRDSFEHIQRRIALSIKKSADGGPSNGGGNGGNGHHHGGNGGGGGVAPSVARKQLDQQRLHQQQQQQFEQQQEYLRQQQQHQQELHQQQQQQEQQRVQQLQHQQKLQQQQQYEQEQHQKQLLQQQQHQAQYEQEQKHQQQLHAEQQQQQAEHQHHQSISHQQQQQQQQQGGKVIVKQEVHKEELFQQAKTKSPAQLTKEEIAHQQQLQHQQQQQQHQQPHKQAGGGGGSSSSGGQQQQQQQKGHKPSK